MHSVHNHGRRLAALLVLACLIPAPATAMPKAGDTAPEFVGRNYDGETLSMSAYAGKVVVLSFWASWCGPCRKELPILEGIQATAGNERIQVIAINIESLDTFRKLARRMTSLRMLVASDAAKEAQQAYGVNGIPHMVIVGKDGRIVRLHRGYTEEGVDRFIDDLNRALAQ